MKTAQADKVFVAIGTDWYDGFSTLQWALRKWCNHVISIVILHVADSICKDYVYTPLGKLPTSSVSEEKLKVLEKTEEAKRDKILAQYIAFCGRIETEVIKIEQNEQPLHENIVQMISSFGITKLVMSFAFMKSSSCKSRTAISGSFHVLRHKPDFCEVFVICGGRLVFLRDGNDEGFVQDDKGFMVLNLKERNGSIKNWLGKMFSESSAANNGSHDSPSSSRSNDSPHQWEKYSQEIEHYVNDLLSLHEDEGDIKGASAILKQNSTKNMHAAERLEVLRSAQDTIKLNRKQANAAEERRRKAEWAISICNNRAEELEPCLSEEVMKNVEVNKELGSRKEELNDLQSEVEEKRSKLNSILDLQKELSNKLHLSLSAKARAEVHLEKAVRTRADTVQEIEELRRHRDVLQQRIEFCKEKDAIVQATKLNGFGLDYREFTASEIIAATEDFSECLRMKSDCCWKNVYRGRINHITVAIKMYTPASERSLEVFTTEVKLLSQVRHPNVLAMIGFCSQLNCIVYEYMHNDNLHDALFLTRRSCKSKRELLNWHARIRIAAEMCSALGFLHKAKPQPIIHGNLKPSKILLDRNNVAKINGLKGHWPYDHKPDIKLDIQAFGNLLLQLLTGMDWAATSMDTATDIGILELSTGEWPTDLATELCDIAIKCLSNNNITAIPVKEINELKERADHLVANGKFSVPIEETVDVDELSSVPSAFLCPIYQDVMQNPHLAADGFSYELESIDEWLKTGHDTSPMTNLQLKHKLLIPNHTLRSLIQDWQNKRSVAFT